MELILKQDVANLGFKDDIVTVKNGYGRNYLIPRGEAVLATTSAKKVLAETLKQRAFKEKKIVDEANKIAEAINHYQKALTIEPKSPFVLEKLARAYKTKKEYQKAHIFYNKILEIMPENPLVYYNIACLYSLQNQKNEAFNWLKKSISKGFDDWDQIKNDKDLKNIKNTPYFRELIESK